MELYSEICHTFLKACDSIRREALYMVGKPEGKRPLGRHRCRCEDNIRMDLREIGWKDAD
jgi:hypothetical protein